ncbi:MAG TPA: hypothetical protein VGD46_23025 [Rhizobacter sp.]
MRNPWLAKNPFMSAWLSAANRAGSTVRGHATAAAKRELASSQTAATQQIIDFWTGKSFVAATPARKRKTKKR